MSFINKSVNYSQTDVLKTMLVPLLEKYNKHMLIYGGYDIGLYMDGHESDILIPNNNRKMYLYVTNKFLLDGGKDQYNILYFFPDEFSEMWYKQQNRCLENAISDFYLETDFILKDSYLFEGYLYKNQDKTDFLITDVLIKNGNIVMSEYNLRQMMLNEIFYYVIKKPLKNLNNYISIGIHPIVLKSNEILLRVMKANFIYKEQICCVEHIVNFKKKRYMEDIVKRENSIKRIEMGKYIDVYNVYDDKTNNRDGILYIKGVKESKKIKEMFKGSNVVRLECIYNLKFCKWQPIL